MKSKLEKICMSALLGASLILGGCGTPFHYHTSSSKQDVSLESNIKASDIKIGYILPDEANIDDLIVGSEKYIQYLSFKKNYSHYGNKIISNLNNNNFKEANNLVRELAVRLESDSNSYAKQYLQKVKNFTYVQVFTRREVKSHNGSHYILGIPLRQDVFGTQDYKKEYTEIEKYRVCPYKRTRIKIK